MLPIKCARMMYKQIMYVYVYCVYCTLNFVVFIWLVVLFGLCWFVSFVDVQYVPIKHKEFMPY